MKRRTLLLVIAALSPLSVVADLTVRAHEGGVRDGKIWGESYTEYHSDAGLRVEVTKDGASSPYMSFLLLRRPDRLFIIQGGSVKALDHKVLETLEAKAGTVPGRPVPQPTALGTQHSVNGFQCSGFRLRMSGQPTRYLCLTPPAALGLPAAYVSDTADIRDMLSRYIAFAQRDHDKASETFNPYRFSAGYPVRLWVSTNGEITWENQLLSISLGPVSPELFHPPQPSQ